MKRILLPFLAAGTVLAVAGGASAADDVTCWENRGYPTGRMVFNPSGSDPSADFGGAGSYTQEIQVVRIQVPCPYHPEPPTPPEPPPEPPKDAAAKWVAVPPPLEFTAAFLDKRIPVKRAFRNPGYRSGERGASSVVETWSQQETCEAAGMVPAMINGKDCRSDWNGKLPKGPNIYKSVRSYSGIHSYGYGTAGTIAFPSVVSGTLCGKNLKDEVKILWLGTGPDDITPSHYACKPKAATQSYAQRF